MLTHTLRSEEDARQDHCGLASLTYRQALTNDAHYKYALKASSGVKQRSP